MRVQDLMTTAPAICLPHDALHRAAALTWEHDCGCLPVCTPGTRQVEGIITDRDICMAAYIRRLPLMDITVAEAMRRPVRVCALTDSLAQVQQIMVEAKIRRLPVMLERDGVHKFVEPFERLIAAIEAQLPTGKGA